MTVISIRVNIAGTQINQSILDRRAAGLAAAAVYEILVGKVLLLVSR